MNLYAIDIETTGLSRFSDTILGIGVYNPKDQQFFTTVSSFVTWLNSFAFVPRFVAHNGSFDVGFLKHNGVDISDLWDFDTRSLASLLTPHPGLAEGQKSLNGLENLAIKLLKEKPYKLDRTRMSSYTTSEIRDYCLKDCELTYKLFTYYELQFPDTYFDFNERWLQPATKFCSDMEYEGVYIDKPGLEIYQAEMVAKRDQILESLKKAAIEPIKHYHELQVKEVSKHYREMYEKAKTKAKDQTRCLNRYALLESAAVSRLRPFNWNSSDQVKWLLKDYYKIKLPIKKIRTNIFNPYEEPKYEYKESIDEASLKTVNHPIAKILLDHRETEKLVGTCIPALTENIEADGFVHTHYHIGGTRTGRLSSSGPNLQQIPRGSIRSYVRSSDDSRVLVTLDYAQIEVRIIAEFSKEEELIHAFRDGIDPYSVIAQKLLKIDCPLREIKSRFEKERDVSKTAGLSILYGTGAGKLQEVLNKELNKNYSIKTCRRFIEDYRKSLPAVKEFKQRLERDLANQKVYYNLLGRPFMIEDNLDLYMKSLNTLVQGSASDLVIHSALRVKEALDKLSVNAQCRLLIHDEQVWELPADEAAIVTNEVIVPAMTTEIERELGLTVPLKVEYSINKVWEKP